MKVMPVSSPHAIQPTGASTTSAADARARAIAKLTATAPEAAAPPANHSAQLNQNAIAPEDMNALRAKAPQMVEEPQEMEDQQQEEQEMEQVAPPKNDEFERLRMQERQARLKAQQRAQQLEQQLKDREAAIQAREQEWEAKEKQYKSYIPKERLTQDALSVLAEAGVSYEQLVEQIVNQQPKDPRVEAEMKMLRQELQSLREEQENAKKAQAQQQTEAYKAAVNQIRMDVKNLVTMDPEFEMVKSTNAVNDVVELIERTFKETGHVMDVEEAAREVENYLVEETLKYTNVGKIKQRLQTAQSKSNAPSEQQSQEMNKKQPQPMKTLTNAASSPRQLSSRERAILAFKGELKS